jgi:hypothetical protein
MKTIPVSETDRSGRKRIPIHLSFLGSVSTVIGCVSRPEAQERGSGAAAF